MIVLIEGPDGAGKTTLAKQIVKLTGATYLHADKPTRHPLVEYTAGIEPGTDYVLDRWHLGEEVYGPIHRGQSGLSPEQFIAVEQFLDELGAVVIYCSGSLATLMTRVSKRGEKVNVTTFRKECAAFDRVAERTWLPTLTSPIGMEIKAEEVVEYAKQRAMLVCG